MRRGDDAASDAHFAATRVRSVLRRVLRCTFRNARVSRAEERRIGDKRANRRLAPRRPRQPGAGSPFLRSLRSSLPCLFKSYTTGSASAHPPARKKVEGLPHLRHILGALLIAHSSSFSFLRAAARRCHDVGARALRSRRLQAHGFRFGSGYRPFPISRPPLPFECVLIAALVPLRQCAVMGKAMSAISNHQSGDPAIQNPQVRLVSSSLCSATVGLRAD